MTLRQNHFIPSVPFLVATEAGLLDDLDLDVSVTTGSAQQLRALADGETDIVVTAIDNLFEWVRADVDLRLIAQVEHTVELEIYAGAEFHSLADLEGRRFSVDAYANGFSLLARSILESAGVQVDYREQGGARERLQALLDDRADAALLSASFGLVAAQAGKTLLASVGDIVPNLPGQGLVARADITESEELAAYLHALDRAIRVADEMTHEAGVDLLQRNGFTAGASGVWQTRPRTLAVDPAGLAVLTRIRESLGALPADIDLDALHDPEPLRRATA